MALRTLVFDISYCLEELLTVERAEVHDRIRLPSVVIGQGQSAKVNAETAHGSANQSASVWRHLPTAQFSGECHQAGCDWHEKSRVHGSSLAASKGMRPSRADL